MFNYFGAAAALVALLAAVWGGYRWGGHELDAVRQERDQLRDAAKIVKQSSDQLQADLSSKLAAQAKAHDAKMDELQQRDAKEAVGLKNARDLAEKNAAAFRAQAADAAQRIDALKKQNGAQLTPEQKAQNAADIAVETQKRDRAMNHAAGEDCQKFPVPGELLDSLNLSARR